MEDLGSCHICGYEAKTQKEVTMWFKYGCCKALVKDEGYSLKVETCSPNRQDGGFYDPGTNPNDIKEDPNALKEGTLHMMETNKAKDEENKKKLQKALQEVERKLEERQKKKPKT